MLLKFALPGQNPHVRYRPQDQRRLGDAGTSLAARGRAATDDASPLLRRLRLTGVVALLVLTADWGSKAILLQVSPSSTIPHYTHPNPLALLLVLAAVPVVLRVTSSRWMVVALGVCIGGSAGNLFQHMAGMPVTDFIPLPHLLANPTCAAHQTCVLMCNVADLALWVSVPLLALAFGFSVLDGLRGRSPHGAAA